MGDSGGLYVGGLEAVHRAAIRDIEELSGPLISVNGIIRVLFGGWVSQRGRTDKR